MRDTKLILVLLAVLALVAVGFVLHQLESVLLPLVIAAFFSQIFRPLLAALRRRRVPAALSILIVLVIVAAVLMAFSWLLYASAQSFVTALPRY